MIHGIVIEDVLRTRRPRRVAIALALPIAMLLGGAAASGPLRAATITEIRVRAAELPARIHSYEFVATTTETRSGNSLITKSHVWQSGDLVRGDTEFVGAEFTTLSAAYNGTIYQCSWDHTKHFAFSRYCVSGNPTVVVNPILAPYLWLIGGSETVVWARLKDGRLWESAFAEAVHGGTVEVSGRDCEVVSMPYAGPSSGLEASVYFAIDLEYFPIRYVVRDEGGVEIGHVVAADFAWFGAQSDEPIALPTAISAEELQENVVRKIEFNEDSMLVNEPIDEEIFTLSRANAKSIVDLDRQARPPRQVMERQDVSAPLWRKWLLVLNGLFIAALVVFLWLRRRAAPQ